MTAALLSLDSFKLPTTFSNGGVVHTHPDTGDEVWTDISVLGHGGQGTVYLQQLQSGPARLLRAVKELSRDLRKPSTGDVMRELNLMMVLRDHEEHFVQLFGWFDNPRGSVFLAMEYVPHGDLAQYIKTTPNALRESREVTKQLLTGLSVLHSRHICHRDLKPQNVLLASLTPIKVKLADFGISKSTAGTDLRTRVGTANYMAPEQLGLLPANLRQRNEYTTAVDMWALGFMVHELLTGKTPFLETTVQMMSSGYPTEAEEGAIDMRLMLQFCDGLARLPLEPLQAIDAPRSAIQFIRRLVVPDPRARPTPAEALLDPWIASQQSSPSRGVGLRVSVMPGQPQPISRNNDPNYLDPPPPGIPAVSQQTPNDGVRSPRHKSTPNMPLRYPSPPPNWWANYFSNLKGIPGGGELTPSYPRLPMDPDDEVSSGSKQDIAVPSETSHLSGSPDLNTVRKTWNESNED